MCCVPQSIEEVVGIFEGARRHFGDDNLVVDLGDERPRRDRHGERLCILWGDRVQVSGESEEKRVIELRDFPPPPLSYLSFASAAGRETMLQLILFGKEHVPNLVEGACHARPDESLLHEGDDGGPQSCTREDPPHDVILRDGEELVDFVLILVDDPAMDE